MTNKRRKSGLTSKGSVPTGISNFTSYPDDALVRQPVVEALFGCSHATVWRWVKSKVIPAPVRVGGTTSWRVGELRASLKSH